MYILSRVITFLRDLEPLSEEDPDEDLEFDLDTSVDMELDGELFAFVFHHIFLPPKPPQKVEPNLLKLEARLVKVVRDVLGQFIDAIPPHCRPKWEVALSALDSWIDFDIDDETVCKDALYKALSAIAPERAVVCHVRAQNCGWMATYDESRNAIVVDAFELSAENEAVVAEPGLLRQFPGVSVLVPTKRFCDPSFLSFLTSNLAQLMSEEVSYMFPSRTRAGAETAEHRATTNPGLVTECLMTQLLAFGSPNDDARMAKHVHDDILWNNALLPWRRSAAWLVIRVALQTIARRNLTKEEGDTHYKNFMLFLMATLGATASTHLRPKGSATVDHLAIIRAKLGRRYYKLKDKVLSFVDQRVKFVPNSLFDRLSNVQLEISMAERKFPRRIDTCASEQDLQMQLRHSRTYLREAMGPPPAETRESYLPQSRKVV